MDIDIADLIKPKFKPGQYVFYITRDHKDRVTNLQARLIEEVLFSVKIINEKGAEKRVVMLSYFLYGNGVQAFEHQLVASLNDLPEADRKAQI